MKIYLLIAAVLVAQPALARTIGQRAPAQDPPRFAPPRPPPLDQDFEDPLEDELENGDAPSRAQMPPPSVPPPAGGEFHPPPSFGAPSASGGPASDTKVKFQIAEGEFYQKGKKRGRTPNEKRMPQGHR